MDTVRIGIIGMGNIGRFHAGYLLDGKIAGAKLTAVCSTSPQKLSDYATKGLRVFANGDELIRSGAADAVLIATPHFQHVSLGIAAFRSGLHVLVEKPIAAHKADAERLIAAARAKPELKFAAMFQMRVEPRYEIMRRMIRGGELGTLIRINWIATDWFRSEAYYASSAWRATWKGEGGGVLINQSLHQLDTLQWMIGMPSRVRGFCELGKFHAIEVEDSVTAHFEWPDKSTGVFCASTGELPGTNRLEIVGTRGRLLLENESLTHDKLAVASDEWSRTAKLGFAKPEIERLKIPFANAEAPHATLTQSFVDAIRTGAPLRCPGEDGLGSIELANAIVFSSMTDRTIDLPLDSAAYEKFLAGLITYSRTTKRVIESSAEDFAKSFRK